VTRISGDCSPPNASDMIADIAYSGRMGFQSTLPHGERPTLLIQPLLKVAVSIHAPSRAATLHSPPRDLRPWVSNPRSRAGSDGLYFKMLMPRSDCAS
jgi:hypothetical protein